LEPCMRKTNLDKLRPDCAGAPAPPQAPRHRQLPLDEVAANQVSLFRK
jgi:hypothetical protein